MVALAGLIHLPLRFIAAFGIVMIVGHNALDTISASTLGPLHWLWAILHTGDSLAPWPGMEFRPRYPLIPWIGVMAAGYAFGALYRLDPPVRKRIMLRLGLALTLSFIILRSTNLYGDPSPWTSQDSLLFTVFSFLNCTKYPPSLLFLLMTLGPGILALGLFEGRVGSFGRLPIMFGRVPLFFYLIHLPIISGLYRIIHYHEYGTAVFRHSPFYPNTLPSDFGYDLPIVYLTWLGVILLLVPPCRWFAGVKQQRHKWWLSYL